MNTVKYYPSLFRDCVVMSLRGSKATEAISQGIDNPEIATLPLVARNDGNGVVTQFTPTLSRLSLRIETEGRGR